MAEGSTLPEASVSGLVHALQLHGRAVVAASPIVTPDTNENVTLFLETIIRALSHGLILKEDDEDGCFSTLWKLYLQVSTFRSKILRTVADLESEGEEPSDEVKCNTCLRAFLFRKELSGFIGMMQGTDRLLTQWYKPTSFLLNSNSFMSLRMWIAAVENSCQTNISSSPKRSAEPKEPLSSPTDDLLSPESSSESESQTTSSDVLDVTLTAPEIHLDLPDVTESDATQVLDMLGLNSSSGFNTSSELERTNFHFVMSDAIITAMSEYESTLVPTELPPLAGPGPTPRIQPSRGHSRNASQLSDISFSETEDDIEPLESLRERVQQKLQQSDSAPVPFHFRRNHSLAAVSDKSDSYGMAGTPLGSELSFMLGSSWRHSPVASPGKPLTSAATSPLTLSLACKGYHAMLLYYQFLNHESSSISLQDRREGSHPSLVAIGLIQSWVLRKGLSLPKNEANPSKPRLGSGQLLLPPSEANDFDVLSLSDTSEASLSTSVDAPSLSNNSPSSALNLSRHKRTRGTEEWAPPRRQIIFSLPEKLPKAVALEKQDYRCTGCGMVVEKAHAKKFRFCNYMGKYFCTSCHQNVRCNIPARVLHKWDHGHYPVANFSKDLLQSISSDPLFDVMAINPNLYRKSRSLGAAFQLRQRLHTMRPYISTCRNAKELLETIDSPPHTATEVNVYSFLELLDVHKRTYVPRLVKLGTIVEEHIVSCDICRMKGFICEICDNEKDILFSFQGKNVYTCKDCQNVYHKNCFWKNKRVCPKCERIEQRRAKG